MLKLPHSGVYDACIHIVYALIFQSSYCAPIFIVLLALLYLISWVRGVDYKHILLLSAPFHSRFDILRLLLNRFVRSMNESEVDSKTFLHAAPVVSSKCP